MSATSGQDKAGNEQTNDDEITVGWEAKPHPFGSVTAVPVRRRKSDAERAMTNMLRLAETASEFEDCKDKFEKQPRFAVNTAFSCHRRLPRRKVEVYLVIELVWMYGALSPRSSLFLACLP
jgi:hypothetical protein